MLVYQTGGTWVVWAGERLNGTTYQPNIEHLWPTADLNAAGLYVPAPFVPPPGKVPTGPRTFVTQPDGTPAEQYAAGDPPVPSSVTPLQARRALRQAGLIDRVNTMVAGADADTKDAWQFTTVVERTNPIVLALAAQLNLTSANLDDLFRKAATL